jgi:Nif-specific regulatory protein
LLESELFGHKKGAFTGATSDKKGLFEIADHGTLFLDEIGDVSLGIQTKLLRVLQEGEIKPVGDNQIRKVDVRIISATNKTLSEEVKQGNFREDLFYRLNVITIKMPPLRDRRDDIPLLANHFLKKYGGGKIQGFTSAALDAMFHYSWPGNVRELENTIQRAVVLCKSDIIDVYDLKLPKDEELIEVGMTLKDFTRKLVLKTLEETGGNRTRAAEILGVSRRWLQYQLKEN